MRTIVLTFSNLKAITVKNLAVKQKPAVVETRLDYKAESDLQVQSGFGWQITLVLDEFAWLKTTIAGQSVRQEREKVTNPLKILLYLDPSEYSCT